jgi:hypothetical protein
MDGNFIEFRSFVRHEANHFNQGERWKAAINRYIAPIPFRGEAGAAEQIIEGPSEAAVRNAIIAKVGAAARHRQLAASTLIL